MTLDEMRTLRPTAPSMAAGLLRVISRLEDPQWRNNAAETSRRLASQWSIASQADAMLALYAEVADSRRLEGLIGAGR